MWQGWHGPPKKVSTWHWTPWVPGWRPARCQSWLIFPSVSEGHQLQKALTKFDESVMGAFPKLSVAMDGYSQALQGRTCGRVLERPPSSAPAHISAGKS